MSKMKMGTEAKMIDFQTAHAVLFMETTRTEGCYLGDSEGRPERELDYIDLFISSALSARNINLRVAQLLFVRL